MDNVKNGETVKLEFEGRLKDGRVLGRSGEETPLEFTIGAGNVPRELNEAVKDMRPGDVKEIEISGEKIFGVHDQALVFDVDKEKISSVREPRVGSRIRIQSKDGKGYEARIVDISDTKIKLDANHFLAGKDAVFKIKMLSRG